MTLRVADFADLLDIRFTRIFDDEYGQFPDRVGEFYGIMDSSQRTERVSSVGTLGDMEQFTGTLDYDDAYQGYDTAITCLVFARGMQVDQELLEDEKFNTLDGKPKALAQIAHRRRQVDCFRIFNQSFSVDTFFYVNSEGVALASNSHTTTSGASTTTGFDNQVTTAFSATSLAAAVKQMLGFRGDRAEKIPVMPDTIIYPVDLYDTVEEVIKSSGKPDVATNNINVHKDAYDLKRCIYLDDANDWWLADSRAMKESLIWIDRVKPQFGMVEEFDEFVAKWRVRERHGNAWRNWRAFLGASVS